MALPDYDPGSVLAALHQHGVDFVLIGGLAAITHGSPFPTEDVDVTPERSLNNLHRLSDALRTLHARVRADGIDGGLPFDHDGQSLAAAGFWNLVTAHGDLDISMVPSGTDGYDDLVASASESDVFGIAVRVASLADIIRSKQAANRLKDQRVLPTLREILATRRDRES